MATVRTRSAQLVYPGAAIRQPGERAIRRVKSEPMVQAPLPLEEEQPAQDLRPSQRAQVACARAGETTEGARWAP